MFKEDAHQKSSTWLHFYNCDMWCTPTTRFDISVVWVLLNSSSGSSTPQEDLNSSTSNNWEYDWMNLGQSGPSIELFEPTLLLDIAGRIDVWGWFSSVHWLLLCTELETSLAYCLDNIKHVTWREYLVDFFSFYFHAYGLANLDTQEPYLPSI